MCATIATWGCKVPNPTRQHRLLIVDDVSLLRRGLREVFVLEGYTVAEAASGTEALSLLAVETFDVMLLDIQMPGMDGIEVMRRVHRNLPGMAVIVMTAYASLDSAITAVRSGAWDYIVKPFKCEDMLAAVSGAIESLSADRERQALLDTISQTVAILQGSPARDQTPPPPGRSTAMPTPAVPDGVPLGAKDRLQIGTLLLEREKRRVTILNSDRPPEDLTGGEEAVLAVLMQQADTVLSCEALALEALGYGELEHWEAESIVRPYIFRLRRKVEDNPRDPQCIRTVRGRGYFFRLP